VWTLVWLALIGRPLPEGAFERIDVPAPLYRSVDADVDAAGVRRALTGYCLAGEPAWLSVPHIAFRDRGGAAVLRGGEVVEWTIRPGGIAFLTHSDGRHTLLLDCALLRP
jgi:hypothetical protein